MTLKMIGTATAIIALSTGAALADCKEDIAAFGERYQNLQNYEGRVDRSTSRTLRDLRTAANRLASSGNEEGCEAVIAAMNEIADEANADMEKAAAEVKSEAKEAGNEVEKTAENVEKSAEEAGEKVEKTAENVEKSAEEAGQKVENTAENMAADAKQAAADAAAALRERLISVTESDLLFDTSDLEGYNVYNLTNEFLGEIDGMLTRAGDAPTHMIVGHGGFLNIGDKEAAIPLKSMMWDPEEEVFYVNMTEEQLEKAPDYDMKDGKWVIDENDAYYQTVEEQNANAAEQPKKE